MSSLLQHHTYLLLVENLWAFKLPHSVISLHYTEEGWLDKSLHYLFLLYCGDERADGPAFLHRISFLCLLNLLHTVDRKWALQRLQGGAFPEFSSMLAGWEVFPFYPRNRWDSRCVPKGALRVLPRRMEIREEMRLRSEEREWSLHGGIWPEPPHWLT